MLAVMESDKTDNDIYHIGTTEETVISDLAETLFDISNWHPKKLTIKKSPEGSVKRRLADVSKIEKAVGWKAQTNLHDGLVKTFEWYKDKF